MSWIGGKELRLSSGAVLAYKTSGTGSVPMVLLHGYSLSLDAWDRVAERFPSCTVVRYDLRGFGRSSHPGDYGYASHVRDLSEVLDLLGLQRPVLVGPFVGRQHRAALRDGAARPGARSGADECPSAEHAAARS